MSGDKGLREDREWTWTWLDLDVQWSYVERPGCRVDRCRCSRRGTDRLSQHPAHGAPAIAMLYRWNDETHGSNIRAQPIGHKQVTLSADCVVLRCACRRLKDPYDESATRGVGIDAERPDGYQGRGRKVDRMSTKKVAFAAAGALAVVAAVSSVSAGWKTTNYPVRISRSGDEISAYGSIGNVRNSGNTTETIGCHVRSDTMDGTELYCQVRQRATSTSGATRRTARSSATCAHSRSTRG